MRYKKILLCFTHILTALLTACFFLFKEYNQQDEPTIQHIPLTHHTIIDELHSLPVKKQTGVRVLIISNPTCNSCDNIYQNICINLSERKIPYLSVFFPENNIDVWLAAIINQLPTIDTSSNPKKNAKLKLFNFLKQRKAEWENITDITNIQLKSLLIDNNYCTEKYFEDVINNQINYHASLLYSRSIGKLFGIKGIPTVAVCMVLSGDVQWQHIENIIATMQHMHEKISKEGLVL